MAVPLELNIPVVKLNPLSTNAPVVKVNVLAVALVPYVLSSVTVPDVLLIVTLPTLLPLASIVCVVPVNCKFKLVYVPPTASIKLVGIGLPTTSVLVLPVKSNMLK